MPYEVTKHAIRQRKISPKRCARGSFRVKTISKRTRLVVCCPKGKWKRSRCTVGMKLQSTVTKRKGKR